jgi:hypothetical protein
LIRLGGGGGFGGLGFMAALASSAAKGLVEAFFKGRDQAVPAN